MQIQGERFSILIFMRRWGSMIRNIHRWNPALSLRSRDLKVGHTRPFKSEQHQPAPLSNMFCCYCLARSIPQYPRPLHRPHLLGFPNLGSTITFMLEIFDPDRSLRPCWIYSRVPRSLKHISTAPGNDTQSCFNIHTATTWTSCLVHGSPRPSDST